MTKKTKLYTNSSSDNLHIPTLEEFHRYASNLLSESDFYTNYSSGHQINRVNSALKWTIKNANQWRNNNYKK